MGDRNPAGNIADPERLLPDALPGKYQWGQIWPVTAAWFVASFQMSLLTFVERVPVMVCDRSSGSQPGMQICHFEEAFGGAARDFNLVQERSHLLLTAGLTFWGGMAIGGIGVGAVADIIGRRLAMLLTCGCIVLGSSVTTFSWGVESYTTARGLVGIGCGGAFAVGWVLAAETCGRRWRGLLGTILMAAMALGMLSVALVESRTQEEWRTLTGIGTALGVAALGSCTVMLQDPVWWYHSKRKLNAVRNILGLMEGDSQVDLPKPPGRNLNQQSRVDFICGSCCFHLPLYILSFMSGYLNWIAMLDTFGLGSDQMLLDVAVCSFGVMLGAGIFMLLYFGAGRKVTLAIGCFGLTTAAVVVLAAVASEGVVPIPHLSNGVASIVATAAGSMTLCGTLLCAVEMAPTVVRTTTAGCIVASMAGGAAVANARVQSLEVVMIVSLSALGMIALLIGIFILIIMPDDLQWKLSHRHPFRRQAGAGFTELPASPNEEEDDDEDDDGEVFPTTPPRVKPYSPFKVRDTQPEDVEQELYAL